MIENYLLHEQIGQGEYGRVFRATDVQKQVTVAVKIVEIQKLNENPKLHALSMTEIKVLQQVSHCPYIIQFIQLIKTPTKYYFVYEYCAGGPLDKLLSLQGNLTEQKALQVFWQLLEAFKTLQQNRIMHRDLKPSNILVYDSNTYKLADFGFCKPFEGRHSDVTSTMLGSPIYMAPEVLRGFSYDTRADIWSLGAVLYELLIGRCPFEEKSIAKLITAQDESDWSIPQGYLFKPQTVALLRSMLVKDSNRRCNWEYLFNAPLNREGFFTGDLNFFGIKRDFALQPLAHNNNYQNKIIDLIPVENTTQNTSLAYSKKDLTPQAFLDSLRENSNPLISNPLISNTLISNTLNSNPITPLIPYDQKPIEQAFQHLGLNRINSMSLNNTEPDKQKKNLISEESIGNQNTLTEVIKERNKLVFLCYTLNDITSLDLIPSSSIIGYLFLGLIDRKYQQLLNVLKSYSTFNETVNCNITKGVQDNQYLSDLLVHLQKKNIKKLTANFEYVRLVDTIEKEAGQVQSSLKSYRSQLESQILKMDRKESNLYKLVIKKFINNQKLGSCNLDQEAVPQIHKSIMNYVASIRSTYYMAFLDQKEECDRNIVIHANQVMDSLQIDVYFEESVKFNEEVIEEFYEDVKKLSKKDLTDRFSNHQKNLLSEKSI